MTQSPDRSEQTVWRITAADVDAMAGRTVTEDELERIQKAIDFSSANDAVEEVVFSVCKGES